MLNMHGQLSPIHEERHFPASNAPLQIHVTAKFHDPAIRFTYNRSYYSSQSFIPTERVCRGLVRRIKHCSEEVITRKDSDALNATQCLRKGPKPLRFELLFEITRAGHSGIWAEASFKSYQKHALTGASAQEVLRATHRIVGLFMRRHDKGFEWTDEPGYDHFPDKPETFEPSLHGSLNLACVPRSFFIESRQTWEFVPGYSLELTFKSSNPARRQTVIRKTLRVDSGQNTPLNLGLGEDLLWQAQRALQDVLDQKKSSFDLEHANCDGFDGVPDCDCQHFDEDALDVGLRVINNLGPVYDHLQRSSQSRLRLFTHPKGQDCLDFVRKIQARLEGFRDQTDQKVALLNDFDFRIAELTGHGWHGKGCARFIIDSEHNHSRRSIEALLDRIRTGVSDVLRGHDVAIRMIAYKRGHLILDKALIARDHQSTPGLQFTSVDENEQQHLLKELKTRIQYDIDMICKDTCKIDDILELDSESSQRDLCHPRPAFSASRPFTVCNTPQRQARPGSPGSFSTRPPTPPVIPSRSSSRVFPLVPAKFQVEKKQTKTMSLDIGSTVGVEVPPVLLKDNDKGTNVANKIQVLKPAAEVYPASKEEYETDSNSTHSSMPALTESDDAPSPDQSMLITPSCVRSSSPVQHGLSSIENLRSHHFVSSPFVMDTSAPNSTTFSDMDRFETTKAVSQNAAVLSGRPGTPNHCEAEMSVPISTPKTLGDESGDEKTPLPLHSLEAADETDELVDTDNGLLPPHSTAGTEPLKAASRSLAIEPDQGATEQTLSSQSEDHSSCGLSAEAHEDDEGITKCDSSETLRPSTVMQQRSIDSLAGLQDIHHIEARNLNSESVPAQSRPKGSEEASAKHSVPTAESTPNVDTDSGTSGSRAMTMDDDLSRSKIDFFEQDEDSAIESEANDDGLRVQAGRGPMGMSDGSELTGHVIPLSDSGIDIKSTSEATEGSGSEIETKRVLSPIDESAFEFDVDPYHSTGRGSKITSLSGLKQETVSDPWISENARRGDDYVPVNTKDLSMNLIEVPESPSSQLDSAKKPSISAPTQASNSVKLLKVRTSDPASTARAVSNTQPSPVHIGLGGAPLFPSFPIFSALRSVSHDTRASWSSSSSWEDVPGSRHSSDSVDTIKCSPVASSDDHPDSPKRLGTPTAGLLGLHESRWAEFGIRTALTGAPASDRPSTAPLLQSPDITRQDEGTKAEADNADDKVVEQGSSSPRKSLHLRQKKSIGSIVTASKMKRKESKELRSQKSVELKKAPKTKSKKSTKESTAPKEMDDGAARFPRAMMLVAGLAFASSVVSRNHS
ncbi:hypothetical protein N0V93_003896 [Gnomoniopsis smithogilvyi]|uniref:Pt repeat family protein n=1 Tax=Gnomoniopsis smithogilvyi TaxID=1191159 RepID=A0A9W9D0A5_9PEZI|nr:hypothetical protein N0V93_003896 [Gnomoniopsis smithogilvyi]